MNIHNAIKNAHERDLICADEKLQFTKRLLAIMKTSFRRHGFKAEKWIFDDLLVNFIEEWFFDELSGIGPLGSFKNRSLSNLILFGLPVEFVEDLTEKYKLMYKDTEEKLYFPEKYIDGKWIKSDNMIIICGGGESMFGCYYFGL